MLGPGSTILGLSCVLFQTTYCLQYNVTISGKDFFIYPRVKSDLLYTPCDFPVPPDHSDNESHIDYDKLCKKYAAIPHTCDVDGVLGHSDGQRIRQTFALLQPLSEHHINVGLATMRFLAYPNGLPDLEQVENALEFCEQFSAQSTATNYTSPHQYVWLFAEVLRQRWFGTSCANNAVILLVTEAVLSEDLSRVIAEGPLLRVAVSKRLKLLLGARIANILEQSGEACYRSSFETSYAPYFLGPLKELARRYSLCVEGVFLDILPLPLWAFCTLLGCILATCLIFGLHWYVARRTSSILGHETSGHWRPSGYMGHVINRRKSEHL